jgi:GH24 family phage-related lysozyme (muramidase)
MAADMDTGRIIVMSNIPQCGIDLIKRFEGLHKIRKDGLIEAYADPSLGWLLPTIGFGTTCFPHGTPVKRGDTVTREQAECFLLWHVERVCMPHLERIPTWPIMNEHQRGALTSFSYNLGDFYKRDGFESITRVCESPGRWGDREWVVEQFGKYVKSGGKMMAGLVVRRAAEAELFCRPMGEPE